LGRIAVALFASLFDAVVGAIPTASRASPAPPGSNRLLWLVRRSFGGFGLPPARHWKLKKETRELKQRPVTLGGKIMMVVDAWTPISRVQKPFTPPIQGQRQDLWPALDPMASGRWTADFRSGLSAFPS